MNTELIDEFSLLQSSRSNRKYLEVLDDRVYTPIVKANTDMSTWVSKRGIMLMQLEARMNRSIKRLRAKYLRF